MNQKEKSESYLNGLKQKIKVLEDRRMSAQELVLGIPPSDSFALLLAKKAKMPYATLKVKRFPDNELDIQFPVEVAGRRIVLVQSLYNPNEKITELLFIARTARELGAREIVLVAPYLAYMRADKRFHEREVISARVLASILSDSVDHIITVDPISTVYTHYPIYFLSEAWLLVPTLC